MTEPTTIWTASQTRAFTYIESGVARGLTATESLSQYRAGGGAIRDSLWYSLFKETFAQIGIRENVAKIPDTYTIPDQMFQETNLDFRAKYVAQIKVRGYSEELQQYVTKWVTVESDELVTKKEWKKGAQDALNWLITTKPLVITAWLDWNILKRV